MRGAALAAVVLVAGCGDDLDYRFAGLAQVSGGSPFAADCNGAPQMGTNYRGAEVEPWVTVDPHDGAHLVGVWQQDRWSNGGSNGLMTGVSRDGGETWTTSHAHLSRCAGGTDGNGGGYQRASDPWVAIAGDGTVWQISISFDSTGPRSAVLVARSRDGGDTWEEPIALVADDDPDIFNDKESITADPTDAGRVYAVWDRLTGQTMPMEPIGTGPTWFARTTGGAWEPARAVYDPGIDNQTIANQIVVMPDGTLIDFFIELRMASSDSPPAFLRVIRSTDHGDTWSAPSDIAELHAFGVYDAAHDVFVRSGTITPPIAVDPSSGALYVAWEAAEAGTGMQDGIALSVSHDAGRTWSPPARVNGEPSAPSFNPALAVGPGGEVALAYYDQRDQPGAVDPDAFLAAAWLARSSDGGATWHEERLTGAFDLRFAKYGGNYFLGDYQGLVATRGTFVPFFVAAVIETDDPSGVFARPAP